MGIAGMRREGQRAIAAKAIVIFNQHRLGGQPGCIDEGEEALAGSAASTRLELDCPATDTDLGIGAKAARIAEAEAKLGAGEVERSALDAKAWEAIMDRLEDAELAEIVRARAGQKRIRVKLEDL